MNIYQLKSLTNTYDVIDLDTLSLAKKLSLNSGQDVDVLLDTLTSVAFDNISLLEMWPNEMHCKYFGKSKEQNFDITRFGRFLTFNMNAFNLLEESMTAFGEFLPLNVEGNKMMLFNCLTFGKEQEELCIKHYEDGIPYGIETLFFEEADIKNKSIFKSKLENAMSIYCTESIKSIVEENNLKGIVFDSNLLDIF